MFVRTILTLFLAATVAGSAAAQGSSRHPPASRAESVTVTGTLTDEGVECRALRGDDGALYTLTGDLKKFKTGDRVTVTGTSAEMSTCMQGTTIAVQRIRRAPAR